LFWFVPFQSISIHFILFHSVSFCFILFHSVSFCFVLFRSVSSSNGAERNIAISLGINYFPAAPLRSVPQSLPSTEQGSPQQHTPNSEAQIKFDLDVMAFLVKVVPWQWWEHHLNILISLGIHYFRSAPLRSLPQSLVHFPVPTERSGTLLTMMGTPLEHCNFSRYSLFLLPTERSGTILHFPPWKNTLKNSFSNFEGWKIFNPFIESCFVSFHQELLTSIRFSMGTPLEHCNFSRYSLFPRRSAPLRSVPQSLPSLNGAERNTFDNDGNTT